MSPEVEIKKLANDVVKLLKQHDLPVVASALSLILAAWLVKTGGDDDDAESLALLAAQALIIAPTLRTALDADPRAAVLDAVDKLTELAEREAAKRVEQLPTRPVRKGPSPWGWDK